jgi:hypothetical protein
MNPATPESLRPLSDAEIDAVAGAVAPINSPTLQAASVLLANGVSSASDGPSHVFAPTEPCFPVISVLFGTSS